MLKFGLSVYTFLRLHFFKVIISGLLVFVLTQYAANVMVRNELSLYPKVIYEQSTSFDSQNLTQTYPDSAAPVTMELQLKNDLPVSPSTTKLPTTSVDVLQLPVTLSVAAVISSKSALPVTSSKSELPENSTTGYSPKTDSLQTTSRMLISTNDHANQTFSSAAHANITKELPLCPHVPPKLVGPLKVLLDAPSFEDLEKLLANLDPGGRFAPKECTARSRVAIIIPYRNREQHLRIFLHNLHPMLMRQQLDYGIYVIEQYGTNTFNRAMLMNIGYVEALKQHDYQCFIFHDVDLIPEDDRNIYSCPEQPRHMSVAIDTMSYKLLYQTLFGGVSALTRAQMEKINGFSNQFWGWGGEDDDMSNRVIDGGFNITRYSDKLARYKMLGHTKDKPNPDRYKLLYRGKHRYKTDGLSSLKYKLHDVVLKKLYTWVMVEIHP